MNSIRPETSNWAEFLEHPTLFRPAPEFLSNTFFIEEETVLTCCIRNQNIPAVEALILAGADTNLPSKKGVTPISAAAHKGNTHIMQLLISHGAIVNSANASGSTALIQAAHFGHIEAVKLLLKNNATADFANGKGTTALMRASQEGHVDISNCLIAAGVDVNRKNLEGMNALMLASQRGHSDMVRLLIKEQAAMDEQTMQGSTALMLACKRGHEKCAEVLVSMGAEIYMRDKRGRTAKDTATRRNHFRLLVWLDTQVQVMRIQEVSYEQRTAYLMELRRAYINGKLRLNPVEQAIASLVTAVRNESKKRATLRDKAVIGEFVEASETFAALYAETGTVQSNGGYVTPAPASAASNSPLPLPPHNFLLPPPPPTALQQHSTHQLESVGFPVVSKYPLETIHQIRSLISADVNQVIEKIPVYSRSAALAKRPVGFCEWQWPSLLLRVMEMPSGIFESIIEYMPLPRVWKWSAGRLKARCKLAPLQALVDMSIMMDEMLIDANIFSAKSQSHLLLKISRNPQIHGYLMEQLCMPEHLLQSILTWADTQSILQRSSDADVTFKAPFAKQMLSAVNSLHRWFKHRCSAAKSLHLTVPTSGQAIPAAVGVEIDPNNYVDEAEMMEATDAGGEDEDDDGSDDEGMPHVPNNGGGGGGGGAAGAGLQGTGGALGPVHHALGGAGVAHHPAGAVHTIAEEMFDSDNDMDEFVGAVGAAVFDGIDSDDEDGNDIHMMLFGQPGNH